MHDIVTGFAVAGMFQAERTQRVVGSHTYTRHLFSDGERDAVLWVVAADGAVTWAVGTNGDPR